MADNPIPLRQALDELLQRLYPGDTVEEIKLLGADVTEQDEATGKGIGYGVPVRITLREPNGARRRLVFHTASPNDFDHDRRSDRAKNMLLAYDTFGSIPRHVRALDTGAVTRGGHLLSLGDSGEFYLLTEFAPGAVYADDLRRIATGKRLTARDESRCDSLVRYLSELHVRGDARPAVYTRAIRNLIGDGEGIFGIIDGYPADVPQAPPERLRAIERLSSEWRWKLRGGEQRLARIHGDFHPFNILFDDDDRPTTLDASRGCLGDPADDVTCLAINYVFFALEHEGAWQAGLGALWRRFWDGYLGEAGDRQLLEVAPPYLAWRALVLCNPQWYPAMHADARDRLLGLAERALNQGRVDPADAEELFP